MKEEWRVTVRKKKEEEKEEERRKFGRSLKEKMKREQEENKRIKKFQIIHKVRK